MSFLFNHFRAGNKKHQTWDNGKFVRLKIAFCEILKPRTVKHLLWLTKKVPKMRFTVYQKEWKSQRQAVIQMSKLRLPIP
jgi:hypothetical protein